ncbi:hypothetical protein BGZ60DRAFT_568882 [Tricladium varicosporioides]|nr:hypothetical protein BGZ60DRAFT_568882 [Hymenoscyphus varicosporioides]
MSLKEESKEAYKTPFPRNSHPAWNENSDLDSPPTYNLYDASGRGDAFSVASSSYSQPSYTSPYPHSMNQIAELSSPITTSSPRITQLEKPIVVPQTTNLFFIKSFSPFSRSYAPALASLPNPISQPDFLSFIDGLNEAFLSPPMFQAMHVIGGGLLGSQILPAQAVGGVFQVTSLLGSAGFTIVRVRKYLKKTNTAIFEPRGLVVKLMSTKKMMASIGFEEVDEKGKLRLPPLEDVDDLEPKVDGEGVEIGGVERVGTGESGRSGKGKEKGEVREDPRVLRIKALKDYISPLTLDVPQETGHSGPVSKYGGAPLRWMNKKQLGKLDKAREKSLKEREKNAGKVQAATMETDESIAGIDRQITSLRRHTIENGSMGSGSRSESELAMLESTKTKELEKRETVVKEIQQKGDKKLNKAFKKEEKIANRILWVVISRIDGGNGMVSEEGEELVQVGSL